MMARYDEPGEIRFTFDLAGGLTEDVVFVRRDLRSIDLRLFGRPQFPPGSEAYDVETNDAASFGKVLWQASKGTLSISTGHPPKALRVYRGGSLDTCVLQAYSDGGFK